MLRNCHTARGLMPPSAAHTANRHSRGQVRPCGPRGVPGRTAACALRPPLPPLTAGSCLLGTQLDTETCSDQRSLAVTAHLQTLLLLPCSLSVSLIPPALSLQRPVRIQLPGVCSSDREHGSLISLFGLNPEPDTLVALIPPMLNK